MRLFYPLRALARPALGVLFLLAAPLALAQTTITVDTEADDDSDGACSFTEAIQAANTDAAVGGCAAGSGDDTIVFAEGLGEIDLPTADRVVSQNLTIDGDDRITLDPEGSRVLRVDGSSTLTIRDITLAGGIAPEGGLIYIGSDATLIAEGLTARDSEATGDDADMGGGAISVDGGSATISGSTFSGNRATGTSGSGGAIINKNGTLTVTGSTFTQNTSNRAGGAIEDAGGTTTLTDVTLDANNAGTNPGNGGGLHTGDGTVTVSGGSVTGNTAVEGGGLWSSGTLVVQDGTVVSGNTASGDDDDMFEGGGGLFNQAGTMTVTGATIRDNVAAGPGGSGGGAFANGDGETTISGTTFSGNTANRAGGGLEVNGGTVALDEVDFDANDAGTSPGNGGALHVTAGTVTASAGEVTGNTAVEGGGFWNNAGWTMTLSNVSFSGNRAVGEAADNGGGGVFNNGGTLDLDGVTLSENTAAQGSGSGGGLLSTDGEVAIEGGVFSQNTASRAGGGIEVIEGTLALTDVEFTGNQTGEAPGNGGALHVTGAARVTVTGGTVSGNTAASEGGGFWNQAAARMNVTGTSFTGNVAEGDDAANGGGAVYNNGGTVRLTQTRIVRNRATGTAGSGGGILNNGGTLRISGGVVDTNSANRAGGGIEDAGGLLQLDSVMVRANTIADAAPGNGGGLHSGGGTVTVTNSSFLDNTAVEGGGLWFSGALSIVSTEGGDMFVRGNTATGDEATNGGGGIYANPGATLTLIGVRVEDNRATGTAGSGGGLFVGDGVQAHVRGGTISDNSANRAGGGIEIADDGDTDPVADLTLEDVRVDANTIADAAPGNGGGLHSGGGTVTVSGGTFRANSAVEGGGLWTNARLVIEPIDEDRMRAFGADTAYTRIDGNTATGDEATNGGGGVYANPGADVEIDAAWITDNRASGTSGSGGGVFVGDGATVTMTTGRIAGNTANRAGAGVEVADDGMTDDETALILGSFEFSTDDEGEDEVQPMGGGVTVSGNAIADANPGNGGGVHVGGAGVVLATGSTFSDNTAAEGAGIWTSGSGSLGLALSTVSGNAATGSGGGVYDDGGGSFELEGVTVAQNTAGGDGGGLLSQSDSDFSFANSIVALNAADGSGDDCFGSFEVEDGNVIGSLDGCSLDADDEANTLVADPMLGALMDNGGPTMTHALLMGSPAIDAADDAFGMDQRGFDRVGPADIGAFERGAASPTCSPSAPLAIALSGSGDDTAVTIRSADGSRASLEGCTLAVYDNSNQVIGFAAAPDGEVAVGSAFTFDADDLPDGTFSPDRGVVLLFSGDAAQGDAISEADLMRVVAAVVYEDGVTTLTIFGGATAQQQADLAAALERVFTSIGDEATGFELALTAQPNPARGQARIGFGVAASADVRVTVYDLLGRAVATLADRTFATGRHHVDLEASRLAAGLYVVRIETGERTETTRLTVVR